MKFNCNNIARVHYRQKWHRWFAWYLVRVSKEECRWLEVVERQGEYIWVNSESRYSFMGWTYRKNLNGVKEVFPL